MAVYPNDLLHPTFLSDVIRERPDTNAIRQNYIGESLLPMQQVPERRLMWESLVSENNLAGFYSAKGKAIPGDDVMFSSHFANLVDVKASRYLDPDVVQKVRDPGMSALIKAAGESWLVRNTQARVEEHVRNRVAWCDDAVDAMLEYMRLQAMLGTLQWPPKAADGTSITEPMPHWNAGETLTVTFPLKTEFKQSATTLTGYGGRTGGAKVWTDNAANPVLDLEVIAELMVEEKGIDPSNARIIMSRSTLSRIAFNTTFLDYIVGKNLEQVGARTFIDVAEVKSLIQTRLGYTIQTYDAQWTYRIKQAGTRPLIKRVKFLPEGYVLIIPKDSNPGYLATSMQEDQSGNYRSGKVPWVWRDNRPPYEREMGVGIVAFPVLTRPEEHFVLNAYA